MTLRKGSGRPNGRIHPEGLQRQFDGGGTERPAAGTRRGGRELGKVLRTARRGVVPTLAAVLVVLLASWGVSSGNTADHPGRISFSRAAAGEPPFTITIADAWGSTWTNNPFSSEAPGWVFQWMSSEPLAVTMPPDLNHYLPALATSWSAHGSVVKLTLRRGVRWQNGSPFTSGDVLTTLLIYGTEGPGGEYWPYLRSVATPTPTSMVFHLVPGVNADVFLNNLLQTFPAPTSVYGKFLPKDRASLERKVLLENQTSNGQETAAAKAAATDLAAIFKKIDVYNPPQFVGNGPFRIVAHTTEQVKMTKWTGFYASKSIHVNEVEYRNLSSNDNVYPLLLSGGSDWSWTGFSNPALVKRYLASPDAKLFHFEGPSEPSYTFNLKRYPFSLTAVRQALAYAMNVPELAAADAGGVDALASPNDLTDGLNALNNRASLTKAHRQSLIRYVHDPAKAAKLLKGVGFRKVGGHWLMPNGKPFKVTIDSPAGWGITSAIYAANEWKSFGIDATASQVGQPAYATDVTKGQFDVAFNFMSFSGEDPLQSLYSCVTDELGGTIGVENVPGLGRVNVASTLAHESVAIGPGQKMNHLTWIWARYFNRTVPVINYDNYEFPNEYSTAHYVDWPPANSDLWKVGGDEHQAFLFEFMVHGYLRPRS